MIADVLMRTRRRLPLTLLRIQAARVLYQLARLVNRGPHKTVTRNGMRFDLDLREGMDLSVYLFGAFQPHVMASAVRGLPRDGVVFDVGANCGFMTLPFAQAVPNGRVYAFEPTHAAFARLLRNVRLNPSLAAVVHPVHAFLSDASGVSAPTASAYASWRVDEVQSGRHPVHGGTVAAAGEVVVTTIDEFCASHALKRLDLIKIDTEGAEYRVLSGGVRSITRWKPVVIFEAGVAQLEEAGITFTSFLDFFEPLGYRLFEAAGRREITRDNWQRLLPLRTAIDITARPGGLAAP